MIGAPTALDMSQTRQIVKMALVLLELADEYAMGLAIARYLATRRQRRGACGVVV